MRTNARLLGFLLIFSFAATAALPARAGLLEFFFPSTRKKEYDPTYTMQAPFAVDEEARKKQIEQQSDPNATRPPPPKHAMPENNTPLNQPHRDNGEISAWLTNSLSEAMTFDQGNYREMLKADEKYFNETGKAEYLKFLTDHNIMKVIESEKFDVRSFVLGQPLLLNEGAVNGVYRWLYEVPMMVSYMERGAKSYKDLEPVNQQLTLTVQVGRIAGVMDGTAILIERWNGKAQQTVKHEAP
ncbi:MAG: hypothetical protein DYH13_08135 [Alphaproteobacteria bacterium PRO2]|nr:hypothetical protein [Alphaproteobacteria bacterium PRO2]